MSTYVHSKLFLLIVVFTALCDLEFHYHTINIQHPNCSRPRFSLKCALFVCKVAEFNYPVKCRVKSYLLDPKVSIKT